MRHEAPSPSTQPGCSLSESLTRDTDTGGARVQDQVSQVAFQVTFGSDHTKEDALQVAARVAQKSRSQDAGQASENAYCCQAAEDSHRAQNPPDSVPGERRRLRGHPSPQHQTAHPPRQLGGEVEEEEVAPCSSTHCVVHSARYNHTRNASSSIFVRVGAVSGLGSAWEVTLNAQSWCLRSILVPGPSSDRRPAPPVPPASFALYSQDGDTCACGWCCC